MLLSSLLHQIFEPGWIINLSIEALWDLYVFNHLMSAAQFGAQHTATLLRRTIIKMTLMILHKTSFLVFSLKKKWLQWLFSHSDYSRF